MKYRTIYFFISIVVFLIITVNNAQVLFSDQIVIQETETVGACSVYSADLDGDGDMDVLSASKLDDKIAWYENINGSGMFVEQRVITTEADSACKVHAADIDGDGDMDVLSASLKDDKIAWYENTDGTGTFGEQQVITDSAYGAISVYASDLDGDGDIDVLSASFNDDKIAWYENTDGTGTFGEQRIITDSANGAISVYASDLNGDGDIDVLSASLIDNKIAWYENTDGTGTFGEQQVITTVFGPMTIYASDLDGDKDMDVLSTSEGNIAWYKNIEGSGEFGEQLVITTSVSGLISVYTSDLDGDGDMDVLSASLRDNKIAWYENTDGAGSFSEQKIITTDLIEAWSVYASDLNGDGDMDVLSASFYDAKIAWYENIDGIGTFGTQQLITAKADGATSVYAADLDGDSDLDILSASCVDNKIAWYENIDGAGTFGAQKIITVSANRAISVYAADLDGDDDMDVLSASAWDNKVAWYENLDGIDTFGEQQVIIDSLDQAVSVYSADLNGDGYIDVLSGSEHKVAWYKNTDGRGTFGKQQIITTDVYEARSVFTADLDGDGDMDVLSASDVDNKIAWYENTDGTGTFGKQQVITIEAEGAKSAYTADLDGDGDMDVVSASHKYTDDKIAWYENIDGTGTFGEQQVISTEADGAKSVFTADLDGDGDMDVLSASRFDNKIAWYENTNGSGLFGELQVISTKLDGTQSVYATDLDGDGDVDVLSASFEDDKIAWYKNLGNTGNNAQPQNLIKPFDLSQNSPNPFSEFTTIKFSLPKRTHIRIYVCDIKGCVFKTLLDKQFSEGVHTVDFNGSELSSGIYIYMIKAGDLCITRKMWLMK